MNIARTPKERLYFLVARYFKFWANISYQRWQPRVIAITGSTGKTTLLEILSAQIGAKAHFSHDANSIYGISFDILGLTGVKKSRLEWIKLAVMAPWHAYTYTHHEPFYVVEIDAGRPGGASILAEWLRPEITALTGIEKSHAEFYEAEVKSGKFASYIDAITHEFMSIAAATRDTLIVNATDTVAGKAIVSKKFPLPKNIIVLNETKLLKDYNVTVHDSEFTVGSGTYRFSYPLPREIWLQLAMSEEIVKLLGGINLSHDLTKLVFPPGRGTVFAGIKDTTLIDSTYNAQLSSMIATLDMFRAIDAAPKWIVIGDIIELGEDAAEQHRTLAQYLRDYPAQRIILVGRRCEKYVKPLLEDLPTVIQLPSAHQVQDFIKTNLRGHETILFKGSQHLEWVIAQLLDNPADKARLPRQSPAEQARLKRLGYF